MSESSVKSYRIPLVWEMYGHVDVEAENLSAAIEYALGPKCPLPDGSYVSDSVRVDDLVLALEHPYGSHK